MLSSENSDVYEYGPQHSTPVKGQETFLNQMQISENNLHPNSRGRFASNDVAVNRESHRIDDMTLLHQVDLGQADVSTKPDCMDSVIDLSKISMIEHMPNPLSAKNTSIFDTLQDINLISTSQPLDSSESICNLGRQSQIHQNNHSFNHRASSTPNIFVHRALEQEFDEHDNPTGRYFHPGFPYSRTLPSDCLSDSDLSKQSISPKTIYQHVQSSEMSFGKVTLSPSKQRMVKAFHKVRSSSVPRFVLTDANICNRKNINLPSFTISDFNRAPAVFIEQDIINKQRQEIQLLMEELGSRDHELNDLVMSHQKQVKVWESNNEKFVALQARLSQYEEELKNREKQLKDSLTEMTRVSEQREVDALELKQTQNEMIKLAERIMENSLYIKEMEAQNQKLTCSLREFVGARQSFSTREKELLSTIEEKEAILTGKQKEIDAMAEHIKFLESQCEELGERNNNTAVESINWKKKYFQVKEEVDRLCAECKAKEESVQKMTQQLHESLQQAIALQKALFTSCEREKCKEEVMYSLRKQHKRTMQELQNIRELYDRLTRDTTLYHLSVKDKEVTKDSKKKDEEFIEGRGRKGRGDGIPRHDEEDKRRQDIRHKPDSNASSLKAKQSEVCEQSFLVKETKERKHTKTEKSGEKTIEKIYEKTAGKSGEKGAGNIEKIKIYKAKTDDLEACALGGENASQLIPQKLTPRHKRSKNEQEPSNPAKTGHTTMCRNTATITSSTSLFSDEENCKRAENNKCAPTKKTYCAEIRCNKMHSIGYRNTSKNADFRESRSLSSSRVSTAKSVKSQMTSPIMKLKNLKYRGTSFKERVKNGDGEGDSSSDVSHIASPSQYDDDELTPADSDGMCQELQRDLSRIESEQLSRLSPKLESSGLESKISNSMSFAKRNSFLRKDKIEKKTPYIADDGSASVMRSNVRKRAMEFDPSDKLKKSLNRETNSHYPYLKPESESYPLPSDDRRHCSLSGDACSHAKTCPSCNCQNKSFSPGKVKEVAFLNEVKSADNRYCPPGIVYKQGREGYLRSESKSERDQENTGESYQMSNFDDAHMKFKDQNLENGAAEWKTRHCSRCKAQDKSCCDSSTESRSLAAFSNRITSSFVPDLSKQDVTNCHCGLIPASSKLSFNEIDSLLECNSSLSKSQSHQLKSVERSRLQMYNALDEINSLAFHHSDQKVHFISPKCEPNYEQNVIPSKSEKASCQDLAEKISTYLVKHLQARREVHNNNNSKSVDLPLNSDLSDCLDITKNGGEIFRHDQHRSAQEGNWNKILDYVIVDNKEEGHKDSDLFLANIDDEARVVQDSSSRKARESRKQIDTSTEKSHQDETNNNSRENTKQCCQSALFGKEHKVDIRAEEQPLCGPLASSFKLKEKECTTEWRLEKLSKVDHPGHISAKSCTSSINPAKFNTCSEESHTESKEESYCEPELLCLRREEDTGFSESTLVPTSTTSLTTRGPSLYKHLSHIHFSEKTRRYEWSTQPVLMSHNSEKTEFLHDRSCNHKLGCPERSSTKFCELIQAAKGRFHEHISDLTEDKSENQFSDSGHFSSSGRSSGQTGHTEKPEGQSCQRSENDFSEMRYGRSGNWQTTCSEMAADQVNNVITKCSKQSKDLHNKNSNNYYIDASYLNACPSSPIEVHTLSPISQVSSHNFDPVVRRLDFTDSDLEESRVDIEGFEICDSIQVCLPVCDDEEEKTPVKDDSRISSSAPQRVVIEARVGVDAMKAQANDRYESHIRCYDNDQNFLEKKEVYFSTGHTVISGSHKCIDSGHTTTSDNTRCINEGHAVTDNSPRCNIPGHFITNNIPSCNIPGHIITNDNQRCTNPEHAITSNSQKYFNTGHIESKSYSDTPINLPGHVQESPDLLSHSLEDEEVEDILSGSSGISINKLQRNVEQEIEIRDSAFERELHTQSRINKLDAEGTAGIAGSDSIMHNEHKDTYGGDQQSLCNEHIPVHREESESTPRKETFDPGRFFTVPENQQKVPDCDTSPPSVFHYHTTFQNKPESYLEDTADSNSSSKSKVTCLIPARVYENSLEEIADTFDDTLSAFLDDSTHDHESFMGTSVSPLSRLHQLLVKSQEMVHSLQKSSVIPKAGDTQAC